MTIADAIWLTFTAFCFGIAFTFVVGGLAIHFYKTEVKQ